jgi:hypothetical protein
MYQAQQLVALACQVCNIPGKAALVGQFLNLILADYAQTIDEDVIRKLTTLNIGPTSTIPHFYNLPADYLRYYDVFYLVQGEPFYLEPFELKDFDKQYAGQGVSNYPDRFTTDVGTSPTSIAFYPPPSVPLAVTIRYRPQTADIATPEASAVVPWFPNQLTLLQDLCHKAMWLNSEEAPRMELFKAEVDERMRKYLIMKDDTEGFAQRVKLDPNAFRPRPAFPPSKKTGF